MVTAPSWLMSPAGQMLRSHCPPTMQTILVISLPKTMPSVLQSPPHSQKPSRHVSRMPRHSSLVVARPRRHADAWPALACPSGQSSSVTQVGSGVGVAVGVDRSRQTPSTQTAPAGTRRCVSQCDRRRRRRGGDAAPVVGPHTWPTGQSVSRCARDIGLVGVGVGAAGDRLGRRRSDGHVGADVGVEIALRVGRTTRSVASDWKATKPPSRLMLGGRSGTLPLPGWPSGWS